MQSSRQIITNKPTSSFLQAGCPSCRPTNSVKALEGKYHIIIIIIIILFAREQYSKQVQMTVEMSRTIRRKDTHLQMPLTYRNIDS